MPATADRPFFSVLVTAYNRTKEVQRCVSSCLEQDFDDLEVVVVDDASTEPLDAPLTVLGDARVRVVRHEHNRGISPARATAVDHARGEWFVMLDSDWTLLPGSLARLRTLIDGLPNDVPIIRSCIEWDDGHVSPSVIPEGVTDYQGRLLWLEAIAVSGASSDAGHCIHRSVFQTTNYFSDRRGAMEALWELDLARQQRSLWVSDVLIRQYADSPNSYSRDTNPRRVVPRLLTEARDQLWMAETMLYKHNAGLATWAPSYRRWLLESAAQEAFLSGRRRRGIRHTRSALRAGTAPPRLLATAALGIVSPRLLAEVKAAGRGWRAGRQTIRGGASSAALKDEAATGKPRGDG